MNPPSCTLHYACIGGGGVIVAFDASDAFFNTVGGSAGGAGKPPGNIISGNEDAGVLVYSSYNMIQGNLIGTDDDGDTALGNGGAGVHLLHDSSFGSAITIQNLVGGATASLANAISGNGTGVRVENGANDNDVKGNRIGTTPDGLTDLGNTGYGVHIAGSNYTDVGGVPSAPGLPPGNQILGQQRRRRVRRGQRERRAGQPDRNQPRRHLGPGQRR